MTASSTPAMAAAPAADVDLVARAQVGDVDAYAELVQRYQKFAVGLAAVVTRDPANAEDVAQEAFLKAYYALERFKPGANFRPWLARIVVNEARNTLAAAKRRGVLHDRVGADASHPRVAASAEESAVANEQHVALLTVLDDQREDDRAVLLYRYVFDLSEAEMAEALECSNGTVKSRLSRALARLRTDMRRVAPLLALVPDLGTFLGQSVAGPAGPLATAPAHDLAAGVLQRIATGAAPAGGSTGIGRLNGHQAAAAAGGVVVVVTLAVTGLLLSTSQRPSPPATPVAQVSIAHAVGSPSPLATVVGPAAAAPQPNIVVVYGGDLSDAQRQELSVALSPAAGPSVTDRVSRDEVQAALRTAGLPVDGSERAVSSAVVTCLGPGAGLTVQTRNVTQFSAAAYANALVAAGITDAAVIVAAPSSTPMTGETAFVGVLKAVPLCHPDQAFQSERSRVAFAQLHATADIAQTSGAWDKAAAIMLRGAQVAITTTAPDDATLAAGLDAAASAEGIALEPAQHDETVVVMRDLASLDHGTYTNGYMIEHVAPDEVRVVPVQP